MRLLDEVKLADLVLFQNRLLHDYLGGHILLGNRWLEQVERERIIVYRTLTLIVVLMVNAVGYCQQQSLIRFCYLFLAFQIHFKTMVAFMRGIICSEKFEIIYIVAPISRSGPKFKVYLIEDILRKLTPYISIRESTEQILK